MKNCSEKDIAGYEKLMPDNYPSGGDLIVEIGCFFLNSPYREGTLESAGKEKLVANMSAFDCSTFVDTVLALAVSTLAGRMSSSVFRKCLKLVRYRGGKIDGYASRLHYFTDWLLDNKKKKLISDISRQAGGKPQRKKIHFMTAHRDLYPALKNENEIQKLRYVEKNLSRRIFHIIDKENITEISSKIRSGDIVAFNTSEDGLDVSHVGFAVRRRKNVYLLHASSKEGAVVISRKTLSAYARSKMNCTGIILARLNETQISGTK